jgi:hypothetical protein
VRPSRSGPDARRRSWMMKRHRDVSLAYALGLDSKADVTATKR